MRGPHGGQMTAADRHVQKLELEIQELKLRVRRINKVAPAVSLISAIGTVVAIFIGFSQFNAQLEQELKKPIREKQLTLVFELSEIASRIATLNPNDAERKKAETRFRELYWGPIIYVEDHDLREWIAEFSKCLDEFNRAQNPEGNVGGETKPGGCTTLDQQESRLKKLSSKFAIMRRKKLGLEWDVPVDESESDKMRAENKSTPKALP